MKKEIVNKLKDTFVSCDVEGAVKPAEHACNLTFHEYLFKSI